MSTSVILIEHQIAKAKGFLHGSEILFQPYMLFSPAGSLLHIGTELYLKALLLNNDIDTMFFKTHDLEVLFDMCVAFDPDFESTEFRVTLRWINQFGAYNGGARYFHRTGNGYVIPLDIFSKLELITIHIDSRVDVNKDITHLF